MSNNSAKKTTHYHTCSLCEAMCGLEIEIDGEDIVSIRGDKSPKPDGSVDR